MATGQVERQLAAEAERRKATGVDQVSSTTSSSMHTRAACTLKQRAGCALHICTALQAHSACEYMTRTRTRTIHGTCMHMQVLDDLEQLEGLVGRMPGEGLVESNRAGRVPSFM